MMTANLHIITTSLLCGVIWIVQIVHYPSFAFINKESFKESMMFHQKKISFIVIPLMALEVLVLVFDEMTYRNYLNLLIVGLIWLCTFFIQVPIHNRLLHGYDEFLIKKLAKMNWIRTCLWTLKLVVICN
jgi:hypothetical protein